MGIALPMFAAAFNALLWLARAGLTPVVEPLAGATAGWLVALLAPLALLGIVARMDLVRRDTALGVAALSLAVAGLLSAS